MNELAVIERARFTELESVVERGMQTFVEVGQALMEIRDERLYRETHGTFVAYCRERWGFTDRRGRQLMAAAEVGTVVPVSNEAQARELVPLLSDETAVVEVWRELKAEHGDKVTAEKVRTAVRQRIEYGEIGTTWPGSSCARRLRERLRKGQAADGTPLDRSEERDRHIWRAIYYSIKASEADYTAATLTWEAGQLLLAAPERTEEFRADVRGAAKDAVRIARRFPSRMSLQLAIDALEEDPGFVSWQMLARWA